MSGFYESSIVMGYLIASGVVTLLGNYGYIEEGWRYLFWAGGGTALFGLFLRFSVSESQEFQASLHFAPTGLWQLLKEYKVPFLGIIFCSGFSYATYSMAFTLMNGFVPLITSLTKTEVMKINTLLFALDMLLLPCFAYLSYRVGKEKIMFLAAVSLALLAVPLFLCLPQSSREMVIAVRAAIMTLGVAFAATYQAWAVERVPPQHRYTLLSLGFALGSQLIGFPTSAIGLWLYQQTEWVAAPALYLALTAALAAGTIYHFAASRRYNPHSV